MKKLEALNVLPEGTVCKRIVDDNGKGIYKVIKKDGTVLAEHLHSNEIWGIAVENYLASDSAWDDRALGASAEHAVAVENPLSKFTDLVAPVEVNTPILGFGTFELTTCTTTDKTPSFELTIAEPKVRHWKDMPIIGTNYYVQRRYESNFVDKEFFKRNALNAVFVAHKIVDEVIWTYSNGFKDGTPICHLDDFYMLDVSL